MSLPYAEEVNHYWMTSQTSPDSWMDKTKRLIVEAGGRIISDAFGSQEGRSAFLLEFEIGDDQFKVIWPVLPTRNSKNERAARIQAATLMYHDVKAKCMTAIVLGIRAAFFSYLLLPDGRPATSASIPELETGIPELFRMSSYHQLDKGDVVEGEIVEG